VYRSLKNIAYYNARKVLRINDATMLYRSTVYVVLTAKFTVQSQVAAHAGPTLVASAPLFAFSICGSIIEIGKTVAL